MVPFWVPCCSFFFKKERHGSRNGNIMVRKTKTLAENYAGYVIELLDFITNTHQAVGGEVVPTFNNRTLPFCDEELYWIKPHHIARHLEHLAYGVVNPPLISTPYIRRSDGLRFMKKAISFHMPNKELQWNTQLRMGNPTKSRIVNLVIAQVALMEVRKKGKKSGVKRDLKRVELKKTLKEISRTKKGLDR